MGQARRKATRRQRGSSSHGFGMFIAGAVVGAVAASFFMGLRSDDPESIGRGIEHMIAASKERFGGEEVHAPVESGPRSAPETGFDFYMVLPEIEDIVPQTPPAAPDAGSGEEVATGETPAPVTVEAATPSPSPTPAAEPPRPSSSASFELQAGAFARLADADRLKARLALAGLESRIQKVTIEGRGDFFRVRLGPFAGTTELESVNRQLAGLGIKALTLRISGG